MTNLGGEIEVVDDEAAQRYEILVGGRPAGFADYQLVGDDVVVFPHTVIDRSMRGRGLAATLVRHALDASRAAGRRVVPQCWYVARFIEEHPDYEDLLARR
jgi:predicted GNAT family acetyltransferase